MVFFNHKNILQKMQLPVNEEGFRFLNLEIAILTYCQVLNTGNQQFGNFGIYCMNIAPLLGWTGLGFKYTKSLLFMETVLSVGKQWNGISH